MGSGLRSWHRMVRASADDIPDALTDRDLWNRLGAQPLAVFLDYDGTLTPIVARPELAVLGADMRAALERLAAHTVVGVISGRDLEDVRAMVDSAGLWYAGSHGFDIVGPDGARVELEAAEAFRNALSSAAADLRVALASIQGAWVEEKRYAEAVHFRQVDEASISDVEAAVDRVVAAHPGLRKTGGKRVFELRPDIDWDKGRALWALFERAGLQRGRVLAVFIGDDLTDEDAFAAVDSEGVGIIVADDARATAARYRLRDPGEVCGFLEELALRQEGP
jgi:trehalose 6-phosphate phosphatase